MLTETMIASRDGFGLRTMGAFPHVRGEVCLEGGTGLIATVTAARVTGAVTAGAVASAGAPAFSARKRVSPAWALGQAPFGQVASAQKTVRTHDIYMTRVIANGEGALGPHRRRTPV